jgi:HD-like signal output (HDOD) protein
MIDLEALTVTAQALKPFPQSTARLAAFAGRDDWSEKELVEIIGLDPQLSMRVLKQANSALYAGRRNATTVREAVFSLGIGAVITLAVGSTVRSTLDKPISAYGFAAGDLWRHGVAASLAVACGPSCGMAVPPEAHVAALLHDVGKLVMAQFLTPEVLAVLATAYASGLTDELKAETEILTVHHGEVGGLLTQHWSLPEPITRAVIQHHTPDLEPARANDVVHVANAVAHIVAKPGAGARVGRSELQPGAAERLKLTDARFDALCEKTGQLLKETLARYD